MKTWVLASIVCVCYSFLDSMPSSQKITDKLWFYWDLSVDPAVFGMKFHNVGWASIGFGSRMPRTDMIVVETNPLNGSISVQDRYSQGYGVPDYDTALGGTNDVTLLNSSNSDGYVSVKFSRKLVTGDRWDAALTPGPMTIVWAYTKSNTMEDHGNLAGTANLNFTQGYKSDVAVGTEAKAPLTQIHSFVLLIIWGFFIDFGILGVRVAKTKPGYVIRHSVIMNICILVTLGLGIAMLAREDSGEDQESLLKYCIH
eukprot:TRINITY_DN8248_c0_g2_i1.p1 TRINITY_DN8248_c0_g2~~TRINITY_DN8248_c0_g2_i1.p1  ORF type:complete len:256 (+),score=14.73 TRINITY_DN8248_c0_g2_i1:31-798(+)